MNISVNPGARSFRGDEWVSSSSQLPWVLLADLEHRAAYQTYLLARDQRIALVSVQLIRLDEAHCLQPLEQRKGTHLDLP
jgi:hypothetical protein